MTVILVVCSMIVGLVIGFLIEKINSGKINTRNEVLMSQLSEKDKVFSETMSEKEKAFSLALSEKDRIMEQVLERQDAHHRENMEAMQSRFDETVNKMKAQLEISTSDLLQRRQSEFEVSNAENMNRIVEPLNRTIKEMREVVADNTMKHTEFGGRLNANLQQVLAHSDAARKSADRLADALRGGGRIQGDWGETVLTELLESQGLQEDIHFDTQTFVRDADGNVISSADGRKLKPDVILHLDRERDVIIDAKVSLSAYIDYMQAETDELRAAALRAHVVSVEKHVTELVNKDYSSYMHNGHLGISYVIMFVPNTSALYAATSQKPDLWRKAMERGVYIADEQTLYAALKIIDMTWRQIAQAENHEKVFALAGEILDRVGAFVDKFTAIGKSIDTAKKSYDDAFAKLQDRGQSIPVTCSKLQKLGAKSKKRDRNFERLIASDEN